MKNIKEYIQECLDVDNFAYKFDVWFKDDKEYLKPLLNFITICGQRKLVQKDDVETFLAENPKFKIKKFVDFFDEDVKRDEAINVDYIYLFTKIIEHFITNFNLFNKISYQYQHELNGIPNTEVDTPPLGEEDDDNKQKGEKN